MPKRLMALTLAAVALAASAHAQSFGRNKVHYEDFDFQILATRHFDIYYYSSEHDAAVKAGRMAERWYSRLSRVLDHTFIDRQPIVLYASHAQLTQTNVIPGFLGEGIGGVTEHEKGRIVLPFTASLGETDHVLGHELVHAFQRDILRRNNRTISTLPLWFVEGMAEYLSVGQIDSNTAMWLRDSVQQNHLPRIDQLDDPLWFPYRYGQALWAYLAERFGEDFIARCLKSKAPGGAIGRLVATAGIDAPTLSSAWQASIRQTVAAPAVSPAETATTLVSAGKNGLGRLNVGPALSPDGRSIAFFSDRDRYSIDVVLADTAGGAIRRKIVETAGDSHFESLQFIDSVGAWDPSGHRFALAALSHGQAVITILDARTGDVERELPIRDVDQVFTPTWSPDGRRIAFSALHNGFSDLSVLDLETGAVSALTKDPYADLQPSWSPDSRTIAFSTDRFSSSVETLTFGEFRLGLIDVASGTIRAVPGIAGAKNIDPHWSADGASLYFIADGQGVSNVYRTTLADGQLFQITDVSTGVSGVTALSPALAVAALGHRLAFSVYRNGAYEIHSIDADAISGTPVPRSSAASGPHVVAPVSLESKSSTSSISSPSSGPSTPSVPSITPVSDRPASAAVAKPTFPLPDGGEFMSRPYHASLSLNRMVQPYLSAGSGSSGSFLRAGAGLSFGDMLGNHQLQTAVQVGKSVDDFIAEAAYLNMRSRWNWGVVGFQVPWLMGGTQGPTSRDGDTLTRDTEVFRQLHRQVSGLAIYPFSRAKRLELSGGLQSISYERETTTSVYSGLTGQLVNATQATGAAAPSAMLVESGAALVYSTSVFGPTSPVRGERYRFGVAPTFGSLTFTTVTADYRRYVMPVRPFTIAMRVMHLGRYGDSSNDPRLLPLVWTLRDMVRGYGDIGPSSGGDVTASRLLVGNAELRFPLAALFNRNDQPQALPIEGLLFVDAGRFWALPMSSDSTGTMLRSAGLGVRLNAAGMVFELAAVRPFDPSPHGWTFAFNFRPGF